MLLGNELTSDPPPPHSSIHTIQSGITPKSIQTQKFELLQKIHEFKKTSLAKGWIYKTFSFLVNYQVLSSRFHLVMYFLHFLQMLLICTVYWLDHIFNYLTEEATCWLHLLLSANIAIKNSLCFSPILVSYNFTSVISCLFISYWQNTNFQIEWEVHFSVLRNVCGINSVQLYVILEKEACNLLLRVERH